jgi:NAD(P)-dependent dehydrogenase (short-subunit alcohol dehydrogenase family)
MNFASFQDRIMVIAGGGSGIGRETALAFARRGAEVVVSDLNLDSAKHTAAVIDEADGTAHAYQRDVAGEIAVHAHADGVAGRRGVPYIPINNAGIEQAGTFPAPPSESFTCVMDINFSAVVIGCRAFGQKMAERGSGGHIVNPASMAAYMPQQSPGKVAECSVSAATRKKSIVTTPEANFAYDAGGFAPDLGRCLAARKDIIQ